MATDCIPQVTFEFQGLRQPDRRAVRPGRTPVRMAGRCCSRPSTTQLGLTQRLAAVPDRPAAAGQGPARAARAGAAARLRDRLRLRRLQRRRPAGRRPDPQAAARPRSAHRAGPGLAADALALRERRGPAGRSARRWRTRWPTRSSRTIGARLKGRARRITIDLDPTDDPTHGQQEFTFFNGHYDTWCYLPLVATLTFNDEPTQYLVAAVLRPGNSPAKRGALGLLRAAVSPSCARPFRGATPPGPAGWGLCQPRAVRLPGGRGRSSTSWPWPAMPAWRSASAG